MPRSTANGSCELRGDAHEFTAISRNVDDVCFEVDEEAKEVELSNGKIELLERCIAMLKKDEQAKRAGRILDRYTTEGLARRMAGLAGEEPKEVVF